MCLVRATKTLAVDKLEDTSPRAWLLAAIMYYKLKAVFSTSANKLIVDLVCGFMV